MLMATQKISWSTQKKRISDLIPYPQNPRQLTEKQHKDLTASLKKFDLVEIPVANLDNTIIAGHQRLMILSQLGRGDEEIDVRVPDRLLDEQELKEYNIRSNKNTGGWDFDKLANGFDLNDLTDWGFGAEELGLNDEQFSDKKKKDKEEKAKNIKIKIIYIRPEDWLNWKNQICNFLNENEIPFEVLE
jgi:ParB-like chromosome segregation protein Spo0J